VGCRVWGRMEGWTFYSGNGGFDGEDCGVCFFVRGDEAEGKATWLIVGYIRW